MTMNFIATHTGIWALVIVCEGLFCRFADLIGKAFSRFTRLNVRVQITVCRAS